MLRNGRIDIQASSEDVQDGINIVAGILKRLISRWWGIVERDSRSLESGHGGLHQHGSN
jgi:hypothetical protein